MNEYTNVPCGGICDEIEEWAALEDDDDSVEYPCEGCIYEFYLTGVPMTPARQPHPKRVRVNTFEGGIITIGTEEYMGILTIREKDIPELIERLQAVTHTSAPDSHPQHCDHEIVCWMYRENKIPQGNQPCMRNHYGCITCTADARITRTSPTAPAPDEKCYIITEEQVEYIEPEFPITAMRIRSRPHTQAPASTAIPLKSCFGDFDDCPCDDECSVSEFCAFYCKKKSVNSCGMTESQCGMVQEHEKAEAAKAAREQFAEELKKDLESRFISSSNQWSKGRNSGLIECCNIIDESLRKPEPQQEAEQPKEQT
jgi:hypothetical protein